MMRAKVGILGHFGEGKTLLNGQTIKTRIITDELCCRLGAEQVVKVDTHGGIKTLFKAPGQILFLLKNCKNIIMLPAQNGLLVYAPLLCLGKIFFQSRKLHYVVIGGWLPEFLRRHIWLIKPLKSFSGIYVETNTMKKHLEEQGFCNIFVMPNCKKLKILKEEELVYPAGEPYKLCTFSRVMKEKGIEDAVNAVRAINESVGRVVYTLDIFGQVDLSQEDWFEDLKKTFPEYIRYSGCVPFEESVSTLKEYAWLLFPTHFYTEGIPGTIIDAYAAGVPVITAQWESAKEIVDDDNTGIIYDIDQREALGDILLDMLSKGQDITCMKQNCLSKAKEYLPDSAVQPLVFGIAAGINGE